MKHVIELLLVEKNPSILHSQHHDLYDLVTSNYPVIFQFQHYTGYNSLDAQSQEKPLMFYQLEYREIMLNNKLSVWQYSIIKPSGNIFWVKQPY